MRMDLQIPPKKLFLIDGLGAVLTTFMLGAVLARYEAWVGMPRDVMLLLALIASGFALYSLSCFFLVEKRWRPFLQVIVIANVLYAMLTLGLVFYFYHSITLLGITYFFLEMVVVIALVVVEQRNILHAARP